MPPAAPQPAVIEGRAGFLLPLRDGTPVFYAPVGPQDEQRLRVGVRELSPASRYLRFFSPTTELSEEQIRRFTRPDQIDHVAWGGLAALEPGLPGLGLGRMVRDETHRDLAEIAVAVADRAQNLGMGTTLLAVLCLLARRHGIREMRALVLPENQVVLDWFVNLGGYLNWGADACEVRLPVPGPQVHPGDEPYAGRLRALMRELEPVLPT